MPWHTDGTRRARKVTDEGSEGAERVPGGLHRRKTDPQQPLAVASAAFWPLLVDHPLHSDKDFRSTERDRPFLILVLLLS